MEKFTLDNMRCVSWQPKVIILSLHGNRRCRDGVGRIVSFVSARGYGVGAAYEHWATLWRCVKAGAFPSPVKLLGPVKVEESACLPFLLLLVSACRTLPFVEGGSRYISSIQATLRKLKAVVLGSYREREVGQTPMST